MTEREILDTGMRRLGLPLPPETAARLLAFSALLLEKNRVMNLTAIATPELSAERHLVDSLALFCCCDFNGKKTIDIGSGAGFPGVPLKLYDPSLDVTLLDSHKKRLDFIAETLAAFGLSAPLVCARAEEAALLPSHRQQYDYALSRGVANMPVLAELCLPFLKVGGVFAAMKSADCEEELALAANAFKILGGRVSGGFDYTLFPSGAAHRIVLIEKIKNTPGEYPRRFARIKSSPL